MRLDPYERFLIAKIKSGRYCPDLWNCNGLYLGYSERTAGLRAPRIAVKSRYTMTAEERHAWNNSYGPRSPEEMAERKARREAKKAEEERQRREWVLRQEEKAKQEAERAAEWEREEAERKAEEERRDAERRARAAEIEAERKARWQERERKAEEELEALRAKRAAAAAETAIVGFPPPVVTPLEAKAQLSRRQAERAKILAASWQCKKCLKPATIEPHLGGFRLKCAPCDESTFGAHELLARVVEAQAA